MIDLSEFNADNVLHYIASSPEEWIRNFISVRIKVAEAEMIRRGLDPNDKAVQLPDLTTIPGIPQVVDLQRLPDNLRHEIARKITVVNKKEEKQNNGL